MLLRKINAVLSLISTILILDHAIFLAIWMLSRCSIEKMENFLAVLANESYLLESQATDEKAEIIHSYKKHFGAGCSKALSCQKVCPVGIETITSIMRMNRK